MNGSILSMRILLSFVGMMVVFLTQVVPTHAAKLALIGDTPFEVRLCPAKCTLVAGHPYKNGGRIAIFESRDGWVRISKYLNAAELKQTFGDATPEKPALWIPASAVAGNNATANASTEATTDVSSKPESGDPIVAETVKKKAEEEKKPKKSAQNQRKVTLPSFRPGTVMTKVAVTEPANEEEPKTAVAENVEAETTVSEPAANTEVAKVSSDEQPKAEAKDVTTPNTEEALQVEPKEVVAKNTAEEATEAPKKPKPIYQAPKPLGEEKPATNEIVAASTPEKPANAAQPDGEKSETTEPKPVKPEVVEKPAAGEADVTETAEAKAANETKVASTEPTFESANSTPLVTEERPKTYIKALKDKRLKKLPGSKTKGYNKEEVIAIRHHALMLLKNEECKGILDGGRSLSQKGWLYVVCSDDPTYLRQFPLEEASW